MMKIINQICAMATSQLMAVDADGLEPDQVNEFLLSSVEKFVGTVDAKQVKAIVR
jgi:hypothetical protein